MIGFNGRLDIEDEMVKDRVIDIIKIKEYIYIKWINLVIWGIILSGVMIM